MWSRNVSTVFSDRHYQQNKINERLLADSGHFPGSAFFFAFGRLRSSLTYLLMILLLGVSGIEVVDKRQYYEWNHQRLKDMTPRVFSYALYCWILVLAALGCGMSFTNYHQGLDGVLIEWIAYACLGFLGAQIIMRIIFLTWDISTDKGYLESMAHEIESRKAEKKELKKLRKAEKWKRNSWISRAFVRGLGFGVGWSIFNPGVNHADR